ncbi:MAG: SHOCT domain-containing protein [Lachnospiraceae bacterium]|nr:SHOCT domain-containing protein [Lachnospiraceae bacterium]
MLIIGKLHYGLLVPLLLQGIGLLANWISSIVYFYKIYGDFTGNIILISNFFQMIPLIALIIAIIICIQNIKQSNKSHFITCILPAILRTIVTIIIFLDSYESFKEDQAVLSVIIYILSLLAFIMLGIWLYVSTIPSNNGFATNQFDEQFFTQSVDNQQYFQQPYAVQYAPQYDQQSTMQQPYIQQPTIQEPIQQPTIQQSTLQQPETPQQRLAAQYEAEAIKTYKELLDNGMITQEEYDLKKKQILGI